MSGTLVVVGGSGGVGFAIAARARANGRAVAVVARTADRLEQLAQEIGAHAFVADATDLESMQACLERIGDECGPIEGYAHAVGSVVLRPLHALTLDEWNRTLTINATSAFVGLKSILPIMMKQRAGSIVLFSSVAVQTGLANHEAIAAAKGAIEGIVRSAAISYARYGIRINAIAPALTRTPLSKNLWASDAMLAASVAMHPLGRIGEPADIAAAALFALSDDAAWMSGQIIGIDGALSAGVSPPRAKL